MTWLFKKLLLALLWVYRNMISPLKPATCRYTPSCSTYALDAVRAQAVLLLGGQVGDVGGEDLTLFAGRAGHQRHVRALGCVARHGGAGEDRLVVRVGVDEQHPPVGSLGVGAHSTNASRMVVSGA